MKRILLFASAIAGLFSAASCQQEMLQPEVKGGVTYEILLPEVVNTKAASHEYAEYDLYYEVYKTVSDTDLANSETKPLFEDKVTMTGNSHTLSLDLLNDQDYTILFWANKKDNYYFILDDLRNVGVKEASSNNDDRDAFCGKDQISQHDAAYSKTVELKRPFAQVNIATVVKSVAEIGYDINPISSLVKFTKIPTAYNVLDDMPVGENAEVTYGVNWVPEGNLDATEYKKVAMNYVLVPEGTVDVYYEINTANGTVKNTVGNVPVKKNYRTNIIGNLLTSNATYTIELKPGFEEGEYTVEGETTTAKVSTSEELQAAFDDENMDVITLAGDITLEGAITRAAADPSYVLNSGKNLTIDLNGHKLSATSTKSGNYEVFLVKGNLTVKNGTIEYKHEGENNGWNAMTCIFDVTAGGVLNLEGVTAMNLGGSDMGFVAHLNNWGEVTLNVDNCTLESNYVPVRVFNSGPNKNNVTIKNSTLKGVSAAFWVHNYTVADFGSEAKAEAQKALLNLNIYNQGNTFSPDLNGIRYGFTDAVRTDANGIIKTVSEDGTEVTLGSVVENGVVRRGVAGAESNSIVTKVVVGENISSLPNRTFYRYYSLETVELPSTLTTLGSAGAASDYGNIFQGCAALKNIVIPESVTTMGPGVFYGCKSLESINIPNGITSIEENALRETGLKSVEFHEGVTYFGAQAFRDCKQLTEVIINAPEFTMEGNTFGIMAAPFTPMTINVANAEMKAYVESKLTAHAKTYITVKAAEATTTEELKEALEGDAKIVKVAAGVYTFPTGSVKAGQRIVCEEGTVFAGLSKLNINGATVVGATFSNPSGTAVDQTISGTFMNCTFEGNETLRWCYTKAGDVVVFENCVVKTTKRGVHFDGMDGDVIFKNCEINGFNAYSGTGTITFEGCTFGHDASKYNGLNIYSNTVVKNCQFNYVSGNTNFIDMEGTGKTLTIVNSTATLDGAAAQIGDFVGGSKLAENTVVIE